MTQADAGPETEAAENIYVTRLALAASKSVTWKLN